MSTAKRIGKYEIVALVSRGPRAAVYRGTDSDNQRPVAIKVIPRTLLDAAALPAFRKFAQALSSLEHPGIAAILEVVENDRAVGMVSELCPGKPLSGLLKDDAHPELKNVWDVARPMLEALATAHANGAVHRDLKPSNLILGLDGRLMISDFGASVLLTGPDPELHYRAPEQFADGPDVKR